MKNKLLEIVANVVFFTVTGWFIVSGFSIESQQVEIINDVEIITSERNTSLIIRLLVCIGISVVMFYLNLFNLKKLALQDSKTRILLSSSSLLIVAILTFSILIHWVWKTISFPSYLGIIIIVFYFTISTAYGLSKAWIHAERNQQKLLIDKKQAELNLIRNQLQPHFLFNALNNLLSMVDQQESPLLANSFEKLSQLLRYVIEETKSSTVSIQKEIEFIKNYGALYLLKYEPDEVNFSICIKGDSENIFVEPGIFIPLVENAFKYGTEPEKTSEISIAFDLSKENLVIFRIRNSISSISQKKETTGIGLQATKERLQLVYPNNHHLIITEQEDKYLVELTIHTK